MIGRAPLHDYLLCKSFCFGLVSLCALSFGDDPVFAGVLLTVGFGYLLGAVAARRRSG